MVGVMNITIKHRHTGAPLFECEQGSGMKERDVLEMAVAVKTNLSWANLSGANLSGADLSGANLSGAELSGAELSGAYLSGANLSWADLSGANLSRAELSGANLSWAELSGAELSRANIGGARKLIGHRPFFAIGPIGSRADYMQAWITDNGTMIRAGCFFGTRAEFEAMVTETHCENKHAQEYNAALLLIDKHVELWAPTQPPSETLT